MIADLLYGPRYTPMGLTTQETMRPLVLDIDTVVDAAHEMERRLRTDLQLPDHAVTTRWAIAGGHIEVDESELTRLSAHDRSQLQFSTHARTDTPDGTVEDLASATAMFRADMRPFIGATGMPDSPDRYKRALIEYFLDRGKPRMNWWRLSVCAPSIVTAIALAAYIWTLATVNTPIPVQILGWVGLIALAVVAYTSTQTLRQHHVTHPVGHRIRNESRAQTYSRRADSKRDWKVGVITAVLALAAGYGVALLVHVFGLRA